MKRNLIRLVAGFVSLVTVAYATMFLSSTPPSWAPIALAVGANGIIMSLMALGATRNDTIPKSLAIVFVGMFVLCAGAFTIALVMAPQEGAGAPLLLGLPVRTAIVMYAVGVLPIGVLPFAYALTFESSTLNEADLTRVRAAYESMRADASNAGNRTDVRQ